MQRNGKNLLHLGLGATFSVGCMCVLIFVASVEYRFSIVVGFCSSIIIATPQTREHSRLNPGKKSSRLCIELDRIRLLGIMAVQRGTTVSKVAVLKHG
jgi:hypothetical protein